MALAVMDINNIPSDVIDIISTIVHKANMGLVLKNIESPIMNVLDKTCHIDSPNFGTAFSKEMRKRYYMPNFFPTYVDIDDTKYMNVMFMKDDHILVKYVDTEYNEKCLFEGIIENGVLNDADIDDMEENGWLYTDGVFKVKTFIASRDYFKWDYIHHIDTRKLFGKMRFEAYDEKMLALRRYEHKLSKTQWMHFPHL